METSLTLLERLKSGNDQEAWKLLNDLYLPLLVRWIGKFPVQENDREDLVQEIFLQLSQNVHKFKRQERVGSFRRWFKSMTINCLRNFVRKKGNQRIGAGGSAIQQLLNEYEDPESDLSRQWEKQHEQSVLDYLLRTVKQKFSEKTWSAFSRTTLDKMRASVVAEELDLTVGAVHTAKSRVLAELRRVGQGMLEEES